MTLNILTMQYNRIAWFKSFYFLLNKKNPLGQKALPSTSITTYCSLIFKPFVVQQFTAMLFKPVF